MDTRYLLLLPIVFPFAVGLALADRPRGGAAPSRGFVAAALALELGLAALCAFAAGGTLPLIPLGGDLCVTLAMDGLGRLFALLVAFMWLLSGLFSQEYMARDEEPGRYYVFLFLTEGALMILCCAADYLTLYLGFEAMTLFSLPLALHTRTPAARRGGLQYLFYSVFGACLGLLGFYTMHAYGRTTAFTPGGALDPARLSGHEGFAAAAAFLTVLGFGAKAGLFPLHAWLPAAHPEAPAGASALLSGVITKGGVLCVLRVVYYQFGAGFLRGTWVQYAWLTLALVTVFLGSMLAYKEKIFKKRLAYSTVSQAAYILFGLALLEPAAFTGAVLHVVVHSAIKNGLFFTAGAVILKTGQTDVRALRGVGRAMPFTMGCFTVLSLGLIGIPPLGGFVSKWLLARGSLASGVPIFGWLGPVVLLISALLTAGYLFPITVSAFLPGEGYDAAEAPGLEAGLEPGPWITLPLAVLTAVTVLTGLCPGPLTGPVAAIAAALC